MQCRIGYVLKIVSPLVMRRRWWARSFTKRLIIAANETAEK